MRLVGLAASSGILGCSVASLLFPVAAGPVFGQWDLGMAPASSCGGALAGLGAWEWWAPLRCARAFPFLLSALWLLPSSFPLACFPPSPCGGLGALGRLGVGRWGLACLQGGDRSILDGSLGLGGVSSDPAMGQE